MKFTAIFKTNPMSAVVSGALLILSAPAHAATTVNLAVATMSAQTMIDDAVDNLSNQSSGPPWQSSPGTVNSQLVGLTGSIAQASGSLSPLQNASGIQAAMSAPGLFQNDFAQAQTQLSYQFEVVGPADMIVPLSVMADLNASGSLPDNATSSSSFDAAAALMISGQDVSLDWSACANSAITSCIGDAPVNQVFDLHANTAYTVTETTLASAEEGGSATAFADPYFFLSANFSAEHPGYSVVVSPGVANAPVAGVPEPATWAMLILGFAGVGAGVRRRRRESFARA